MSILRQKFLNDLKFSLISLNLDTQGNPPQLPLDEKRSISFMLEP